MRRRSVLYAVAIAMACLVMMSSSAAAQGWEGDKVVFGGSYVLPAGQELRGNLAVIGGDASLAERSIVVGDIAVLGGALHVSGTVRGDIVVFGGRITLDETARVEGDFAAFGGLVQRAPGAVISGEVFGVPGAPSIPSMPPLPEIPQLPPISRIEVRAPEPLGFLSRFLLWELQTLGWALLLGLLGVVAMLVAPVGIGRIASTARDEPILSFGIGLLTVVVGALAGAILLIACGLGLLVWLIVSVGLLVGWIAVGLWIGQVVLRALKVQGLSSVLEVALGVFLVTFLARLPWCVGFLFAAVVGSVGLGAVVLTRFGTQAPETSRSRSLAVDQAVPLPASSGTASGDDGAAPSLETETAELSVVGEALGQEAEVVPPEAVTQVGEPTEMPSSGLLRREDDLEIIIGIGSVFAQRLRRAGITTLADLAAATAQDLAKRIDIPAERIERDDWIGQARQLTGTSD